MTFAGVTLVLFGPKLVYKSVERTIEILVVVITVGLIVVALAVGTTDTWKEIGSGLVNFGHVATEGKRLATVSEDFQHELDDGLLTDAITRECVSQGIDLTQQPTLNVVEKGRRWIIHVGRKSYVAAKREAAIHIHSPGMNIKALFIAIVFSGAG